MFARVRSWILDPGMAACPACGRDNPDGFQFCGFCASPLGPAEGHEVRKTVTVLFSDVTGSTALGELLDPESLRTVMSRYFDLARTAVQRHGGTVEKFIGDAVMAVFGVPVVHEDDALRAVRAATEIREGLAALNDELDRGSGVRLETRTGVNSGEVMAGDPSSAQSFVSGDTVNVAARLEQAATAGEILIGEIGSSKRLEGGWQDAPADLLRWNCRERSSYSLAREQRRLVQKLHRITHEDFSLILFATVGHEQVMQVDR